jgi:DNA polymerase III delta subunit
VLDDVSLSEENVNKDAPARLKKLTDDTGALPPIIQSRTRKQAKKTYESLMMGAEPIKTVTTKQRKFRKELQIQLLKIEEEENKKKIRNKLRNGIKKQESRNKREIHPTRPHLREWKQGTRTISQRVSETCVTG